MEAVVKRRIKIGALSFAIAVMVFLWVVIGYVLYVVCSYSRLRDNIALSTLNNKEAVVGGGTYSLMTYNIGFGAYCPEFSFFMDTGTTVDGKKLVGKYGTALSKQSVLNSTNGAVSIVKQYDPDFVFLQEVDTDSDRSYHVNQYDFFKDMVDYGTNFAVNYHSAYLFYPFNDPHGKSNAGIVTMSKYSVSSAMRRSYPLANDLSKFLDLDRCFSVSRLPMANGKELVLVNHHMSAYDKGGVIRRQQVEMLGNILTTEYEAGNYVIAGGDFNHDMKNTAGKFPSNEILPEWVSRWQEEDTPENFSVAADETTPTCRNANSPYVAGVSYTVTIDGFLVSDNITINSVESIDTQFAYSDHNPVLLKFTVA